MAAVVAPPSQEAATAAGAALVGALEVPPPLPRVLHRARPRRPILPVPLLLIPFRTRRSVVAVVTAAGMAAAEMAAAETAAALAAPFPEGRAEAEVRAGLHAAAPAVHRRPRARRPGRIRTAINVPSRPIAVLATAVSSSAKPSSGLVRSREPATAGMSSLATITATTRTASGMAVTATVSGTSTIRSGARTALDTPAMGTEGAMATAEGTGTAEATGTATRPPVAGAAVTAMSHATKAR